MIISENHSCILYSDYDYLSSKEKNTFDYKIYIELRKKEGRLYSDEQLKKLPYLKLGNQLDKEWKVRSKTFENLLKYFRRKIDLKVLEVGCGNGWLSNGISLNTNNYVVGLDLNEIELKQAAEVFIQNKKLVFAYGDIFENIFPPASFDAVIFASSVQYFQNLTELINRVFHFLKEKCEIHIIDSNFYTSAEINAAKKRTEKYYEDLGFPEMIKYYHHHLWEDLKDFNFSIQNQKSIFLTKIKNKVFKNKTIVFPWIKIVKS